MSLFKRNIAIYTKDFEKLLISYTDEIYKKLEFNSNENKYNEEDLKRIKELKSCGFKSHKDILEYENYCKIKQDSMNSKDSFDEKKLENKNYNLIFVESVNRLCQEYGLVLESIGLYPIQKKKKF